MFLELQGEGMMVFGEAGLKIKSEIGFQNRVFKKNESIE